MFDIKKQAGSIRNRRYILKWMQQVVRVTKVNTLTSRFQKKIDKSPQVTKR